MADCLKNIIIFHKLELNLTLEREIFVATLILRVTGNDLDLKKLCTKVQIKINLSKQKAHL